MKKLSCSVWCAIAALTVGSFCCRAIADDTNDTKQTSDSSHTLELRSYPIQPGVFKTLVDIPEPASQGTVSRLKQTNAITSDKEIQKFFVDAGVPFPEGSFITYSEKLGLLVVRNSHENLDLLDRVMGGGPCLDPTQVVIEARFVQMPRETAHDIFKPEVNLGRVSVIKEDVLRRIREMESQKKITVLAQPRVTTVSGNTAQVKSVEEFSYVVKDPCAPRAATNWPGTSAAGSIICYAFPSGFETREIGTLLNATPTVGPDGRTINLTLVPEITQRIEPSTKIEVMTPKGKIMMVQPRFRSRQVTTTVQMTSGTTILLAVTDPVEGEDRDQIVLVLLTATVVYLQ